MRSACLLFLLLFTQLLFSQSSARRDTIFCDCGHARVVTLKGSTKVGPTIPPAGPGEKNEISRSRLRTPYAFEKEHHTAWYKLVLQTSGMLSFDLVPAKPDDDYDFMLFRGGKNNFCDSLEKYRVKPLRANISRDKTELSGKTGMTVTAKKDLVKEGVNDAYTTSLPVKKGEIFYLAVDNVYEHGDGHTLLFYFEQKVSIQGVVKNDEDQPLPAHVTVTDIKGVKVSEANTDKSTGAFTINAVLRQNVTYSLNYFNDSSFVFSKTFTVKDSAELKSLRQVLPKLRKGKKYSIGAINFYGGSPEFLPSAKPSVENLLKLMQVNKHLKILIEGHVNCATPSKNWQGPKYADEDKLSVHRAEKIRDYLRDHGIDGNRIETSGKGCSEMLFPVTSDEHEMEQNRRVEIKVLEF